MKSKSKKTFITQVALNELRIVTKKEQDFPEKKMVRIEGKKIFKYLITIIMGFCLLSLAGQVYRHTFGLHKTLKGLIPLFNVDLEKNIPTFFSSILLLSCSTVLFVIYRKKHDERDRFQRHWAGLALIFLYLSIDEMASIHELADKPLRNLLNATGYLYATWILLGVLFSLIVFFVYCRFLISLESRWRTLFLLSGGIYIAGAIGMEMIGNNYVYHNLHLQGKDHFTYAMINTLEEFLEMTGAAIFLYALLQYSVTNVKTVSISFEI